MLLGVIDIEEDGEVTAIDAGSQLNADGLVGGVAVEEVIGAAIADEVWIAFGWVTESSGFGKDFFWHVLEEGIRHRGD